MNTIKIKDLGLLHMITKKFFHISDCEFSNIIKKKDVVFNIGKGKNNNLKTINIKWK